MTLDFKSPFLQSSLAEFIDAYLSLDIGPYTESIALDIIEAGPEKTIAAFHRKLNDQLDRDRINSTKLRTIHINRFYPDVYSFNKALENFKVVFGHNDACLNEKSVEEYHSNEPIFL